MDRWWIFSSTVVERSSTGSRDLNETVFLAFRRLSVWGDRLLWMKLHKEAVGEDLRRSPFELGYSQNLWDGKLLSHHLAVQYGVKIGVRQCLRLFHQFGFRRRKPRPMIAKADPEAQCTYKKTSPVGKPSGDREIMEMGNN